QQAPNFELVALDGKPVSLESLRGSVVVVEFIAVPMGSSRKASQEVNKLAETFKDKPVKVLGVAARAKDDEAARKYFADLGLSYTGLLKGDDVAKQFQVKGFPSFYVIDREGKVVRFIQGTGDPTWTTRLQDAITAALGDGHASK
ncbi:MAG TPA: TlpA disulfide reductase family protein, partial [Phycisphaerales bacterium]|nr:TlpA disulfide reductase family protein [Phycisphaerales bacterium]